MGLLWGIVISIFSSAACKVGGISLALGYCSCSLKGATVIFSILATDMHIYNELIKS